jgi:hypothetical protein
MRNKNKVTEMDFDEFFDALVRVIKLGIVIVFIFKCYLALEDIREMRIALNRIAVSLETQIEGKTK